MIKKIANQILQYAMLLTLVLLLAMTLKFWYHAMTWSPEDAKVIPIQTDNRTLPVKPIYEILEGKG